ncbi:hypothetical protein [Nocardia macrotermitis]|uniref:Uncharacterized protein n=1 Tax=Nocardia macrotermitis TaxID=2585198 RepID=A0A7K0CZT9_9NOCA|nr:hypothetical protein [Nocardia macrotermitis]MQY18978.1 hypothetical protein [Nocardia macrotermitis]
MAVFDSFGGTGIDLPRVPALPWPSPAKYRLDVVATDVLDVIEHAGGWLFDRGMAGWEVRVLIPRGCDARPLRILGAQVFNLGLVSDVCVVGHMPQALAMAASIDLREPRTRRRLVSAWGHRATEVVMWGAPWPPSDGREVIPVRYALSAAARVFKAHAIAAVAGTVTDVAATEAFFRSGFTGPSPGTDLQPVS